MTESDKETEAPKFEEPLTAEHLKNLGNDCVREKNFLEAILYYTQAIKITPNDFYLFSNRSLAFLRTKQYYNAFQDAEQTITLNPNFGKGYFRKAEVQREIGQYDCALLSYGRALQLCPNDSTIINIARKTAALSSRETMFDSRIPWLGSAIGLIFGIVVVISDQLLTKNPSVQHPTLMVLLVITIAFVGYFIAKACRYYIKLQRKGMIEPPADLLNESADSEDQEEGEDEAKQKANRTRYTKSQARYRFKKGKS